jgi:hypothetical protein
MRSGYWTVIGSRKSCEKVTAIPSRMVFAAVEMLLMYWLRSMGRDSRSSLGAIACVEESDKAEIFSRQGEAPQLGERNMAMTAVKNCIFARPGPHGANSKDECMPSQGASPSR